MNLEKNLIKSCTLGILLMLCSCGTLRIDEEYAARLVKDKLALGGTITAKKLSGGLSGAKLFIADDGTKKYVVRFLTHKTPKRRQAEINSLKIASEHGYGPHVYFTSKNGTIIIMEYLQAQPITLEQRKSTELYVMLGRLLKKIHAGPALPNSRDVFLLRHLNDVQILYKDIIPEILEIMEQQLSHIKQILMPYIILAPCHISLNPDNLMFLGTEFKAIDYEAAAQADPYYDIATVSTFNCFNQSSEDALLSAYFDRKPTVQEKAHLYLMKQVVLIKHAIGFLKLAEQKKQLYTTVEVQPYLDFLKSIGSINLEDYENQLRVAKVIINQLIINLSSKEFRDAVDTLKMKTLKD